MTMLAALQDVLRHDDPDYAHARRQLAEIQRGLDGLDLARAQPVSRLVLALQGLAEDRAGTADAAVLLRQVIRTHAARLAVRRSLWRQLSAREQVTGLRVTDSGMDDTVELVADPWEPAWLPHVASVDSLAVRRYDRAVVGDGTLYAMTGYTAYQSEAQKAAVEACLFAAPGSTTLVTLPTGAGKSLCSLMPAWLESEGGRVKGGSTLVIVPTVSLAHDQEAEARRRFAGTVDAEYTPASWTSATGADARAAIYRGLRHGTLPLLYLSPEALLESVLHDVCLEAARAGTLNRLVIDEAHIVDAWGAQFRTHFQYLAGYQRALLHASGGRLRTVLLSATVSQATETLLARLFAPRGDLCLVRANRLRPEPSYWFAQTSTEETRRGRVLDALHHLPRPAILYVTRPEDAAEWVRTLRAEGFERVAAYSGLTAIDERQRLIREWNTNARDIMVATSAFGLGVDKGDVRTVIHACLPENVDRYYQEVGRGGRDGCSAISLVLTTTADHDMAYGMTTNARITADRAWDRWQGMRRTATFVGARHDLMLVDTNAVPATDPDMARSDLNRSWNEHTLFLLARAGCIRVTDERGPATVSSPDDAVAAENLDQLQIEILVPDPLHDPDIFMARVQDVRDSEKTAIDDGLAHLTNIARTYAGRRATRCLAYEIAPRYPHTAHACGGCASCRGEAHAPYCESLPLDVDLPLRTPTPDTHAVDSDLRRRLGAHQSLIAWWDGPRHPTAMRSLDTLLIGLLGAGMRQFILPIGLLDDDVWARNLVVQATRYAAAPHIFAPTTWATTREDRPLMALPTVVVYPPDDDEADKVHRALRDQRARLLEGVPVVHIIHRALYLPSENGTFLARLNGLSQSVSALQDSLLATDDSRFF